jgi:hypothetical protein
MTVLFEWECLRDSKKANNDLIFKLIFLNEDENLIRN